MADTKYDVGGTLLERPFKVQRLGHVALCVDDLEAALHFYSDLLGMNVSDAVDFAAMFDRQTPDRDGNAYFLHLAADHHSTVLFPIWTMPPRKMVPATRAVSHLAWQVATMEEVVNGGEWLRARHESVRPGARDPAGSNYNATIYDPNTLPNELYYGMDQIGWSGCSRPPEMWAEEDLPLPSPNETIEPDFPEVRAAIEHGLDMRNGLHRRPWPEERHNVDGVMLPRPFRIVRNSPVGLFVEDMEASLRFYRETMGFIPTGTIEFEGHNCHFLRTNTEHHSLALLPTALRGTLPVHPESICAYYGLQVQNYRQLRNAVSFFRDKGLEVRALPAALTPGMDYTALVTAPDGHAILLYHRMEQIGWDGQARPLQAHPTVPFEDWPETLEGSPESYTGFVFQGPIG